MDNTAEITANIGLSRAIRGILDSAVVSGNLDAPTILGAIDSPEVRGSATIPMPMGRMAIHYETTATWNSMTEYVALRGHIYVYSDYTTRVNDNNTITKIPAIKVGDGTSYLVDLPFTVVGDTEKFVEHIANAQIHVSTDDRESWDSKVYPDVSGDTLWFRN